MLIETKKRPTEQFELLRQMEDKISENKELMRLPYKERYLKGCLVVTREVKLNE